MAFLTVNNFSEFRHVVKGFETFAGDQLRSDKNPCPEGDWDPVQVLSLNLRMNLCSRSVTVEVAEIILGS